MVERFIIRWIVPLVAVGWRGWLAFWGPRLGPPMMGSSLFVVSVLAFLGMIVGPATGGTHGQAGGIASCAVFCVSLVLSSAFLRAQGKGGERG